MTVQNPIRAFVAASLLCFAGAVNAATAVLWESDPGDYIGQGETQVFKTGRWTITPNLRTDSSGVSQLSFGISGATSYSMEFEAPQGDVLKAGGSYGGAARFPFNGPQQPGLSVSGDGRGCNTLSGWFQVLELSLNTDGSLQSAAVDFKQNCEAGNPALYGSIRYKSKLPIGNPDVVSIAGPDMLVREGGVATLDGSQSYTRLSGPLEYSWKQTGGPAVLLDDVHSATPRFTPTDVPIEGARLKFELRVRDAVAGLFDADKLMIRADDGSSPQTLIQFHGDAGDYITGGRAYSYDPGNASILFYRNFDNGVSLSINGDSNWNMDFAAAGNATLVPGVYENAERFPFQASNRPGLSVDGDGRGCNTVSGEFTVYEAEYNSQGEPEKLAIDLEQHCEGGPAALYGQVRLNSTVPVEPSP